MTHESRHWVTAADINALRESGGYTDYWWWWWNGDEDSCPVPVHVQWSGTGGYFFASVGQFGWNRAQTLTEMGGLWMKIVEPAIPQQSGDGK